MNQTEPQGPGGDKGATVAPGPLAGIVRRGALISAVTLVFTQIVSLVSVIWLARLLSPAEVGIYAAGTILSGLLISISIGGLRVALIQREHDVEDAADTVFWRQLPAGCCLASWASPRRRCSVSCSTTTW